MRVRTLVRFHLALILAALALPTSVVGAPPTLDYLYPAGAQQGATVTVTASGTIKNWPVQAWCNQDGVTIKADKERGKLIVQVDAKAMPGTCWVRVHDAEGASNLRPFIIGMLPEANEQEPNDSPTRSQTLAADSFTVNGRLEKSGDVDVFGLTLGKGQTLVASMKANNTLKSPMDASLQVVSQDGFVLEQNDDCHGLDPQVVFTAPEDGRYFVRTFAFPETPNSTIGFAGAATFVYRLTLCTTGFADHAWPLAVSRSSNEQVEVVGWNIPKGMQVSWTQQPGGDPGTIVHPQIGNPVQLAVEPHPCIVETTGAADSAQTVAVPVTISGRIEKPREVDAYLFSLKKGEQISVNIEAASLGAPLDPVLRLLDSTGKLIQEANARAPGTDPTLTVRAAADTSYRLEVKDLYDNAGLRCVYRLRLAPPTPDYSLKVTTDRFVATPGKTVEIPVTIERQNGFKEAVLLEVSGQSASPVVAKPGDKAIKFQIKAGDDSTPGPFSIVGRVEGQPTTTRLANAPLKELGTSTPHLWLAIQKNAPKKP